MSSNNPAGRPVESTPEERELLVRIRNEARKKYNISTNKKHTCRFCKKEFFQCRFGSHLFKKHPEELKKMFEPYSKIQSPHFPYGNGGLKPCFVCQRAWEGDGYMESHAKKNPECSAENQLKAIYAFLGCEPPRDSLTIHHSHPPVEKQEAARDAIAENDVLYKQMAQLTNKLTITNSKLNTATLDNEALKGQIEAYKADLKAVRLEKLRVELREEFHKKKLFFESELLKEKLTVMTTYLSECDKNKEYAAQIAETLSMKISGDELAELEKLRENAKMPAEPTPPPHPTPSLVPPAPAEPIPEPIALPIVQDDVYVKNKEEIIAKIEDIKAELTIRQRKALGIYVPKATKSQVNEIVAEPANCKYCNICGGKDEYYDLKACRQCNKDACADNDFKGCYMYDCNKCAKQICYACIKQNGTTKLKPLCSSCVE